MAALTPRWIVRGLPRLALLALTWCTLTGGVFSGCHGLFTPAIPEPPKGAPIVLNYRSPELTLRTMTEGMQAKADGASAWLGAFADSSRPEDGPGYHQFFDVADVVACACDEPADWRRKQEEEFYLYFLDTVHPSDDFIVTFEPYESDPTPSETVVVLNRRYRIEAKGVDETVTVIAIGIAHLTFEKIAADRWLITRWNDQIDPDVGIQPGDSELQTLGRRRLESPR
jgi:hypothetical protein